MKSAQKITNKLLSSIYNYKFKVLCLYKCLLLSKSGQVKKTFFTFSDETLGVTLRKQDSCWSQFTFDSSVSGESVR